MVEPARPAAVRDLPRAYWLAVATVCVGAFMNQLDASIVTVAMPSLQRQFDSSIGAVTWVGLSYLLVLVGLVTAVGRLADMVGRKLLYLYGFVIFVIASTLCGLAPSLGALCGFRVLQGVGAAMIQANSVAIIVLAVPAAKLGRAIGIQGAAQALGLALGPTLGGLLLAVASWRFIFFVNVPVGLLAVVLGWFLIPRSRDLTPRTPFDWAGLSLFFPAVVAFMAAISFGNDLGWSSPAIVVLLVGAVGLGVAFVWRERRASSPMVDLRLFRRVPFSAGIASGLLSYLVLFGVLFLVPFYLERVLQYGPGAAGLALAAMPVALGLTAPFAGHFAERLGARPLTVAGMGLAAVSIGTLVVFHASVWQIVLVLLVVGVGLGLFTPPNNASVMGSAPRTLAGVASGILNMTRGLGTAMGLAFTGLVFATVAGSIDVSTQLAEQGFKACAVFLAAVALVAAGVSMFRGGGALKDMPRTEAF
jgi:EmrB/QacA subfamily drug resistance transporter